MCREFYLSGEPGTPRWGWTARWERCGRTRTQSTSANLIAAFTLLQCGLRHSERNLHVIVLSQGDPGAEGLPGIPGPPGEDGAAGLKVTSLPKPVFYFYIVSHNSYQSSASFIVSKWCQGDIGLPGPRGAVGASVKGTPGERVTDVFHSWHKNPCNMIFWKHNSWWWVRRMFGRIWAAVLCCSGRDLQGNEGPEASPVRSVQWDQWGQRFVNKQQVNYIWKCWILMPEYWYLLILTGWYGRFMVQHKLHHIGYCHRTV